MIEIVTFTSKGERLDTAEAETPEAAMLAARTMLRDHADVIGYGARSCVAKFFVDGKLVGETNGRS